MDNRIKKYFYQTFACVFLLCGSAAHAVQPRVYQLGDSGAIAPHVNLEFGNDSNPLRANEGSGESTFFRLEPTVSYLVRRRNNELELRFEGDYYQYFEEYCQAQAPAVVRPGDCLQGSPTFDKASYFDLDFSLNGSLEISSRLRARLELSQEIQHQPLGTGQSTNRGVLDALTTPDAWNDRRARAELAYGASQARGEVRVGLTILDRDFESDLDVITLDERSIAPDVRLLYRIGTRTQLFAGLSSSEVRGGNSASERDVTRQIIGAEFDASAITSGSVSISNETEDFLDDNRRDLQFLGVNVELTWQPRRFSTVTINASRESERGLFQDDIGISTRFAVDWEYFWRERFSTRVGLRLENNEDTDIFSDASEDSDTEDDDITLRLQGNYNVRRWVDVGGFLEIDSRDGQGEGRDFDRNVIGVTVNGTF